MVGHEHVERPALAVHEDGPQLLERLRLHGRRTRGVPSSRLGAGRPCPADGHDRD